MIENPLRPRYQIGEPQSRGASQRFFRTLAGPGATAYPSDPATVYYVEWLRNISYTETPGNQSLNSTESGNFGYVFNLETANYIEVGNVGLAFKHGVQWYTIDKVVASVNASRVLHRVDAAGNHLWSAPPFSDQDRVYDLMVQSASNNTTDSPAITYLAVYYAASGGDVRIRMYGDDGEELARFPQQIIRGVDTTNIVRNSTFVFGGGLIYTRYSFQTGGNAELWRRHNAIGGDNGDVGTSAGIGGNLSAGGRGLRGNDGILYPVQSLAASGNLLVPTTTNVALMKEKSGNLGEYAPSAGSKIGRSTAEDVASGADYLGTDNSICKVTWTSGGLNPVEQWVNTADVGVQVPALQVDSSGNLLAAVGSKVLKFDPATGALAAELFDHGATIRDLALDSSDNILIAGDRNASDAASVRKLDSSGSELWKLDTKSIATCIDVDRDNDSVYFGNV